MLLIVFVYYQITQNCHISHHIAYKFTISTQLILVVVVLRVDLVVVIV